LILVKCHERRLIPLAFFALSLENESQYHYLNVCVNSGDDVATSCKNLVKFCLVTPEIMELICVPSYLYLAKIDLHICIFTRINFPFNPNPKPSLTPNPNPSFNRKFTKFGNDIARILPFNLFKADLRSVNPLSNAEARKKVPGDVCDHSLNLTGCHSNVLGRLPNEHWDNNHHQYIYQTCKVGQDRSRIF